jgi:hypothetical protein
MVDAGTLSAVAAAAAAVIAGTVAAIQLCIGHRETKSSLISANAAMMSAESAGRHTVAAFRQKWIETVRDTLSEYHAILMSSPSPVMNSAEDTRRLAALDAQSPRRRFENPPALALENARFRQLG